MTKVKRFFRNFWMTLKGGKYLLLKYFVSAILMSVVSILANLLGVEELTYLNAILAVDYFTSMLAFGVGCGINVLANQNIKSKFRVRKYIRIGFRLTLIIVLLFVVILACFPKFIMEGLTSYIPQDYTFYYIMCAYAVLSGLRQYINDMLKELQIFKFQFFSEILTIVITIVGFAVLYFAGIYYLNLIAVVYIISEVVGLGMGIFFLAHNKLIRINIFKPQKVQLSKKQWWILCSNLLLESIWEVGYFATSVLLLRMSDAYLNTYSYMGTIFGIVDGLFFTWVNVNAIRIARKLGTNQFDDAFKNAKWTMLGSMLIWFLCFLITLIFIYPISLGANDAYFKIMFTVVFLFGVLCFIRFISWNFGSYMLGLGGKTKILLCVEVFCQFLVVTLCFIVRYCPQNIYLAYFLIALPDLVAIPIYVVIFLRKKWLANINADPALLKNKVKCFIFDFDDTLYYGVDWSNWKKLARDFFNEHFSHLTVKQRKQLLKKHRCGGGSAEGAFLNIEKILNETEGSCEAWLKFTRNLQFNELQKGKAVPFKELEKCKRQGKIYIVSNSSQEDVRRFAKFFGIDLSIFDGIFTNEFAPQDESKGRYYKNIMDENNLSADQILVVGNNFTNDLLPAKKLGMNFYKCENGFSYEEIVD